MNTKYSIFICVVSFYATAAYVQEFARSNTYSNGYGAPYQGYGSQYGYMDEPSTLGYGAQTAGYNKQMEQFEQLGQMGQIGLMDQSDQAQLGHVHYGHRPYENIGGHMLYESSMLETQPGQAQLSVGPIRQGKRFFPTEQQPSPGQGIMSLLKAFALNRSIKNGANGMREREMGDYNGKGVISLGGFGGTDGYISTENIGQDGLGSLPFGYGDVTYNPIGYGSRPVRIHLGQGQEKHLQWNQRFPAAQQTLLEGQLGQQQLLQELQMEGQGGQCREQHLFPHRQIQLQQGQQFDGQGGYLGHNSLYGGQYLSPQIQSQSYQGNYPDGQGGAFSYGGRFPNKLTPAMNILNRFPKFMRSITGAFESNFDNEENIDISSDIDSDIDNAEIIMGVPPTGPTNLGNLPSIGASLSPSGGFTINLNGPPIGLVGGLTNYENINPNQQSLFNRH